MYTIHQLLLDEIEKLVAEREISEEQLQNAVNETFQETIPAITEDLVGELKRRAPKMLREQRRIASGFRKRNEQRWRPAFDLLEMLYVICEEAGGEFDTEFRPDAAARNDTIFEAVASLHARALLVANEILWLLKGGFADGALGRWRTLHEVAVVAVFLTKGDRKTAERYLMSFHVEAYRAMLQYQNFARRAGLTPFTKQKVDDIEGAYSNAVRLCGESTKYQYGWASEVLDISNPTFLEIERNVGLDHWRPRYKWASQYNHANYKPPSTYLGMKEASDEMLLIGPSNSGLTDPAHMMATSLNQATIALLLLEPNLDRLIITKVLMHVAEEVGSAFAQAEEGTLERHRTKKNRGASGAP